jgi:CBS domain-containing protein
VRATTVSQIMTRDPVVARPSMPVRDAAARMADRGVSGLPVVDGLGRVVGVIADGDLLPEQRSAPRRERTGQRAPTAAGPLVADMMTMPAATCSPELTVAGAAEVMRRTGLRRLVVVGAGGVLLGVVTLADLAAAPRPGPEHARRGAEHR